MAQKGYCFVPRGRSPAEPARHARGGFMGLGGAHDHVGALRVGGDHDRPVAALTPALANGKACKVSGPHRLNRPADGRLVRIACVRRAGRIAEHPQARDLVQHSRPEPDVVHRPKIPERVQTYHKAARMRPRQKPEFGLQELQERQVPVIVSARHVHGVAVAVGPACAAARAGGALFQRQVIDRQASPRSLLYHRPELGVVGARHQQARTIPRADHGGRKDCAALAQSRVIRPEPDRRFRLHRKSREPTPRGVGRGGPRSMPSPAHDASAPCRKLRKVQRDMGLGRHVAADLLKHRQTQEDRPVQLHAEF